MSKRLLLSFLAFQMTMCTLMIVTAEAVTPTALEMIARVTGARPEGETMPNPNQTDTNYQITGTDLGIVWDKGGGQYFVLFGDTNGFGPNDWRSNTLVHYMSVYHWGDPGYWQTNYSGISYSDNNGATWTKHPTARWYNNRTAWDNKFQMAAFVKDGGFVYMYATPNGRFGDVYLARVPEGSLHDINAYRYWDGNGWSASQSSASAVANGVAGELSVAYNSHFKRYIMTYLNEHRQAIVMRDAPTPIGPWSGEKILVPGNFTGLGQYNAFIHPLSNNSDTLYFIMSTWYPDYNTHLMKATLTADLFGDNIVSDPGFETQGQTPVSAPWYVTGEGGIDRNLGYARTGQDNGYVRNGSGWNAIKQRVAVQPYKPTR